MACVKKRVAATDEYEMSGNTGTVIYMAPEVALRQPYTEKADIYSFGMILWQMTTGTTPFAGTSPTEINYITYTFIYIAYTYSTYIHTYIHTYIRSTYKHTYIHIYLAYIYIHSIYMQYIYIHTYVHTYTHT